MNEFFAPLYEFFYYSVPFSDDIFQEGQYAPIGITAILTGIFFGVLFYYIINRPSFSRWYHWLIILGINFLINFLVGTFLPQPKFSALGLHYSSEYYMLGLANGAVATCVYILFMLFFRWFSTNAKQTPIPH